MNIDYARSFDLQYKKMQQFRKSLVRDAIELFIDNPFNKSLRNHPLKDQWVGYRSITVGGDLRILYKELKNNRILMVAVGTHEELYK